MQTLVSGVGRMARKVRLLAAGAVLCLGGCGNPPSSESAPEDRQVMEPRFLDDVELALERAEEIKQPVLIEFTGSDWCPPCIKLHKETIATEKFKDFSERDILFVVLDFPRHKAQPAALRAANERAAARFRISGFPTLILLDYHGKELGRQEGFIPGGPDALIGWIRRKANL